MKLRMTSPEAKLLIGCRAPVLSIHESALRAEVGVPRLREQVDPQLKRNTLLIPGPDQDEHASIFVVVADQELRECGACRLGERPGDF